jgi:hypothetical protein
MASFQHCGFTEDQEDNIPLANLVEEDEDDDLPLSTLAKQLKAAGYPLNQDLDDWTAMDDQEPTAASITTDDIVLEVQAQEASLKEKLGEAEEEEEEEEDPQPTVHHTIAGAKDAVAYLQDFLLKREDSSHLLSLLGPVQQGLDKFHNRELRQSSISDFFRK